MMFRKTSKEPETVQPKEVFRKVNGIESVWIVERLLEFPGAPLHVRLVEKGGNDRTVTVALSQLLDTRFWTRISPQDKKES